MCPIPDNLKFIHEGQEFLRNKSLEAIEGNEDLSRHVEMIERSMDVLNLFATNPPGDEGDDAKAFRLLGMRLFNGCAAAFQLVVSGYYQNAAMLLRDLLETAFLLGYLRHDQKKIAEWRGADDKTRKKVFAPVNIRIALDERDGFTEKRRAAAYELLCELASHPTYKGLQMLAPKGLDHHCGPFFDATAMKALIEELTHLAIQAGTNYMIYFHPDTKPKLLAKIYYIEACGEWRERYFGQQFDRKELEEWKALVDQMA